MVVRKLVNTIKELRPAEIIIDDKSLLELGIKASSRPVITVPKVRIDRYEFSGRDGFVEQNHGTVGSREASVKFYIKGKSAEQAELAENYLNELMFKSIIIDFYNSPFGSFTGRLNEIEYASNAAMRYSKTGEMKFILQPYRKLHHSNNKRLALQKGDKFLFEKGKLFPIFHITGSGDFTLTIEGDKTYQFRNVANQGVLTLDSVNRIIYQSTNSGRVKANHVKFTKGYPELKSDKAITWSGNITKLELEYEWGAI